MNELELIERIRKRAGRSPLALGIGDDCAIFRPRGGEDLLFTTDQMIEGTHFTRSLPAAAAGERALARSLSDIAAMGGEPRFCTAALAVPKRHERWIEEFFTGLLRLAKRTGAALAGGDLAHSEKIYCDVMVCGAVPRGQALRRDGARPGDAIFVSGRLGKSWTRPIRPRLALGIALRGRATSCIDLSDGLSLDLHRLCAASGAAAELARLPVANGSTLDRALHGGEDYELLFTLPPQYAAPRGTSRIGKIVRGAPGAVNFRGRPLAPRGYDHFARRD
ncbi:MAG TPA: thiamine-phosphate kinase [Bryobacteraceae bacterium]|nr:thiamine-phosphate kinase [Bryobacteraceae bacterium]